MLSLIVLQGPGKGHVFRLRGDKSTVIGRQSHDLRLLDRNVSRRHAEINYENGTWILRDLGSSNGTFVNGERVEGLAELEEGDQLQFGHFVLVVGQLSTEAPSMHDTRLVDAESMDQVGLSPALPGFGEISEQSDDILRVESVDHAARPEEPANEVEEPTGESAHASMFDFAEEQLSREPEEERGLADVGNEETPSGLLASLEEEFGSMDEPSVEEEAPEPSAEIPEAAAEETEEEIEDETIDLTVEEPAEDLASEAVDEAVEESEELVEEAALGPFAEALDDEMADQEPAVAALEESSFEETAPAEAQADVDAEPEAEVEAEADEESDEESDESPSNLIESVLANPFEAFDDLYDEEMADAAEVAEQVPVDEAAEPAAEPDVVDYDKAAAEVVTSEDQWAQQIQDQIDQIDEHLGEVPVEPASAGLDEVSEVATEPEAEDVSSDVRSPEQDDEVVVPRPIDQPSKAKMIWPVSVAILLLVLGGGTTLIVTLGRSWQARQANAVPVEVEAASPVAEVSQPLPDTQTPSEALMTSPLDDGPKLLGQQALMEWTQPKAAVEKKPELKPESVVIQPEPELEAEPVELIAPEPPVAAAPPPVAVTVEPSQAVEPELPIEVAAAPAPEVTLEPAEPDEPAEPAEEPPVQLLRDPDHVAYLVDASGSLVDTFPLLLDWLGDTLRPLESPTQYTVIFFRAGDAIEVPPAGLKDAGDLETKLAVLEWINWEQGRISPSGRSDPRKALNLALGYRVGRVCILSDGHVGDRLDDEQVADYLTTVREQTEDDPVQIHNVQFFYDKVEGFLAHLVRQHTGSNEIVLSERGENDTVLVPFDVLTGPPE